LPSADVQQISLLIPTCRPYFRIPAFLISSLLVALSRHDGPVILQMQRRWLLCLSPVSTARVDGWPVSITRQHGDG